MPLKRSNVEFAKRVFLDRLTTDQQPLFQPALIDVGAGDEYVYGGTYDPFNFGIGADCSGSAGIFLGAAQNGPGGMVWGRLFSTETFPGPLQGWRKVASRKAQIDAKPTMAVAIHHGGGGPNSHMNCWIDGWLMESNGDHGTCTTPYGAISMDDPYWNDWWVYTDPIEEDTTFRQAMSYPLGLDYAGGHIAGASLKNAGVVFVCRYITDGGSGLPNKRMTPDEAHDLLTNGIEIVSNWESYANRMREGYAAGKQDAEDAQDWHHQCGGPDLAPIYFSCDYDEPEADQAAINAYLQACGDVLGGPQRVGIYGGYWPLSRALNAGVCHYSWQTEGWSGGNIDSRINIFQRNNAGYKYIDGIECDINEAHTTDFGQWSTASTIPPVPPVQPVATRLTDSDYIRLMYEQLCGPIGTTGYGTGWPQNGQDKDGNNLFMNDTIVKILGLVTPKPKTPAKKAPAKKAT